MGLAAIRGRGTSVSPILPDFHTLEYGIDNMNQRRCKILAGCGLLLILAAGSCWSLVIFTDTVVINFVGSIMSNTFTSVRWSNDGQLLQFSFRHDQWTNGPGDIDGTYVVELDSGELRQLLPTDNERFREDSPTLRYHYSDYTEFTSPDGQYRAGIDCPSGYMVSMDDCGNASLTITHISDNRIIQKISYGDLRAANKNNSRTSSVLFLLVCLIELGMTMPWGRHKLNTRYDSVQVGNDQQP